VSLNNTYVVKPTLTWEQRVGVVRQAAEARAAYFVAILREQLRDDLFSAYLVPISIQRERQGVNARGLTQKHPAAGGGRLRLHSCCMVDVGSKHTRAPERPAAKVVIAIFKIALQLLFIRLRAETWDRRII
jgi:hypothetical protein